MKEKIIETLSAANAAKQVKDLLNAIAKIGGIKCQLSVKQIKMLISASQDYLKIYVNKLWGSITLEKPDKEEAYLCITITRWFDEDEYVITLN